LFFLDGSKAGVLCSFLSVDDFSGARLAANSRSGTSETDVDGGRLERARVSSLHEADDAGEGKKKEGR
jgi:hypothetical protein